MYDRILRGNVRPATLVAVAVATAAWGCGRTSALNPGCGAGLPCLPGFECAPRGVCVPVGTVDPGDFDNPAVDGDNREVEPVDGDRLDVPAPGDEDRIDPVEDGDDTPDAADPEITDIGDLPDGADDDTPEAPAEADDADSAADIDPATDGDAGDGTPATDDETAIDVPADDDAPLADADDSTGDTPADAGDEPVEGDDPAVNDTDDAEPAGDDAPPAEDDPVEEEPDPCFTGIDNRPPVIIGLTDEYSVVAGQPFAAQVGAVDPDPCDTVTLTVESGPPGAVVEGGAVRFIAGNPGTVTLTLLARDNKGAETRAGATILVVAPAQPPQWAATGSRALLTEDKLTFHTTVVDPENRALRVFVVGGSGQGYVTQVRYEAPKVFVTFDAIGVAPGAYDIVLQAGETLGPRSADLSVRINVLARATARVCTTPVPLVPGDVYEGDLTDTGDDQTAAPPCIEWRSAGPDMVFSVALPAGAVRVDVTPVEARVDPAVWWREGCGGACLTGNDLYGDDGAERLDFSFAAAAPRTLVIDTSDPSNAGRFRLTVTTSSVGVENRSLCQACTGEQCGPGGNCIRFFDGSRQIEAACGRNCAADNECPRGYRCRDSRVIGALGDATVRQCRPVYNDPVNSCAAFRELGNGCRDRGTSADELECGADDNGAANDASCTRPPFTFSSICVVACGNDQNCPDGFSCRSGSCRR